MDLSEGQTILSDELNYAILVMPTLGWCSGRIPKGCALMGCEGWARIGSSNPDSPTTSLYFIFIW